MPTITVKNMPDEVYDLLKNTAKSNRRSINSEVIWRIEQSLGLTTANPEIMLPQARKLRRLAENHPISGDAMTQAKQEGRPCQFHGHGGNDVLD